MLIGNAPAAFGAFGGSFRYSLSTDAVKFEWWRLFSGAVGHYSLVSFGINMFGAWWVGRYLAPRLRLLRFVALASASVFCGALVTLLLSPHGISYAGLSLSAGLVGAQLAGQKRGTLSRLIVPQMQRFGYASWFIGWLVLSSLFSGLSSMGAIAGGFACGLGLGWLMFERSRALLPNMEDPNERRHGAVGFIVAAIAVLAAVGVAQSSGSVVVAQRANEARQIEQEIFDDFASLDNPITEPNSFRITMMEDKNDVGDIQAYTLTCGVVPKATGIGFISDAEVGPGALRACKWITANASVLAASPTEVCETGLVWQTGITGVLADGRPVEGFFEITDEIKTESYSQPACGTDLALEARNALWGPG
jgi:membrane associated rhomboid family serine protease